MTPQVGFEPTTRRLTVVGSAAELLRNENTLCSSAEGAPRGFPPLSHAGWIPILFSLGDVSTDVFQSVRAGDGDRTRDKSLEGSHVTATPHPQCGTYMREEVVVVSLNAQ